MASQLPEIYTRELLGYGLGFALHYYENTVEMQPGIVGYFSAAGDWVPITRMQFPKGYARVVPQILKLDPFVSKSTEKTDLGAAVSAM
jgi:hypothetical protein